MVGLDIDTVELKPVEELTRLAMERGNKVPQVNLIMKTKIPSGSHINMIREANGVGLKANLPSWKINGFGYFSLGRISHLLFSSFVTRYISCCNFTPKILVKFCIRNVRIITKVFPPYQEQCYIIYKGYFIINLMIYTFIYVFIRLKMDASVYNINKMKQKLEILPCNMKRFGHQNPGSQYQ